MTQKKKNHITRASRRDRNKHAKEVRQAIDALGRQARARRKGNLNKKPERNDS